MPLVTLDSLGLPRCDLIKIDAEGMEHAVLCGARETIARFRPFLYVENDREDRSAELIRLIDELDYAMYWHSPPLYNVNNYFGNAINLFGNVVSINMLCVHRSVPFRAEGFTAVEVPQLS